VRISNLFPNPPRETSTNFLKTPNLLRGLESRFISLLNNSRRSYVYLLIASNAPKDIIDYNSENCGTYKLICEPLSHEVFFPYDVSQNRAATSIEFTSLDCATPPGFLYLLTFYSAQFLTALFHTESVHGVETLRGFPLPVAATNFSELCPSSQRPCLSKHSITQGFMHLGDPFSTKRFYPDFAGRSSLSLFAPPRITPLKS
jgi:hypothetical protein